MGFLERIAGKFLDAYGNDVHKIAFVFPTRRAGLYFVRYLQNRKKPDTTIWAPSVFSINDFIAELSGTTVSDQLDLIFELYDIYRKHVRNYPKEFEDFYPWGKMIISDFDEIDKYLIDTETLFRTLKEFKAVEDITKDEKSEIYNRFTGFWEDLGVLYREFNRLLKSKHKAYEGMIYREVVEDIRNNGGPGGTAWDKVIFCGFNALTKSEETIISHLLKEEKAEIYWDMDSYFVEDKNQEAGHFFRKNRETLKLEQPEWIEERLGEQKNVTIIGVQSKVSQAKVLGIKLKDLQESLIDLEDIVVVLPDETLLFPTLNSLPESVDRVNITIGFPLQQTPAYSLFDSIIEMQLRMFEGEAAGGFYYKDMQKVLNHPYIKPLSPEEITRFIAGLKDKNRVYGTEEDIIPLSSPLKNLFRYRKNSRELIDFFLDLLRFIRTFYRENKPDLFSIDYEYMYHFYTLLSRLKDSLRSSGLVLDIHTFRHLFTDIVNNSRIPFTGEPLEGLQIMGMLETQTLDFSNLYVLSVNEGYLPPGKRQDSFIPFDVRKMIGLPTYKDRDAIAAYHFYRLLKSSENITLIYTTGAKGIEKSEKSRFIDQLLIEYAEKNKKARIDHHIIDFSYEAQPIKEISIEKSGEILDMLHRKSYSASALLNYSTCSLKFYFTYILKLQEDEEVYESPDYRLIGNIIHETLKNLYEPFCGREQGISYGEIEDLKKRVDEELIRTYKHELKTENIHTGKNRIVFEVIRKFLENFFEKEKQAAGFKILMLERKIKNIDFQFTAKSKLFPQTVKLEGTIDRLDITPEGIYRIIDYKTGKVNSLNLKTDDELPAQLTGQEAVKRKEVFQLFFYRYLLTSAGMYEGEYRLGIYPFKRLYEGLTFVKIDKLDIIDAHQAANFEEILTGIFRELFDTAVPFSQTEETQNCRYCPYHDICNRETTEYQR